MMMLITIILQVFSIEETTTREVTSVRGMYDKELAQV